MSEFKVATAVLCYNRVDLMEQMIDQLKDKEGLYILDNGSYPPLLPSHKVPVLRTSKNRFFSGGWNYFMQFLGDKYSHVWMLNSDVLHLDLQKMANVERKIQIIEKCAAITPAYNSPHEVFHNHGTNNIREVRWVDHCCPLFNTEAWKDVNGFDDKFKGYGADLDMDRRLREKGWRFFVDDSFEIHHIESQTARSERKMGEMNNVEIMNRLLKEKWGVQHWSEMY